MSTYQASRAIQNTADQPTMATVLAMITDDETITARRRHDMASALRGFAKAMGHELANCPAHPGFINKRLKTFTPAMAGLSVLRWRNIISLTRAALTHANLTHMPGRYREPLAPAWAALFDQIRDTRQRHGLSRFCHYCTVEEIAPELVDDAVLAAFHSAMDTGAIVKNARKVHRTACLEWNKAALVIPAWPQQRVTVPDYRRGFSLPWSTFPPSLKADIDGYLKRLAGADILNCDFRPLRPASLQARAIQIRAFVSALVLQGQDPHTLRTLGDVVTPEAARLGLNFYLERADRKATTQINGLAYLLLAIATHWAEAGAAQLAALRKLCKKTTVPSSGMTEKNRARVRPFADPANLAALMTLPHDLLRAVQAAPRITQGVARMMQTAVAIELLIMTPMRITNLANLDTAQHLPRFGKRTRLLAIPGIEVKNGMAIDAELPDDTVALLELYDRDYRPQLADQPSTWLFPGRLGRPKCTRALGRQISDCVRARLGLEVHPHLFRHIALKGYLTDNPGGYGVMQRVLGHKSSSTMTKYYGDNDTTAAIKRFDDHILKQRPKMPAITSRPRTPR